MSLVASTGLAQLLVASGHVEDVVDDLEEDAELAGKPAIRNCLRFGHSLEVQHDADRGGDQPAGLQPVQGAQRLGVPGLSDHVHVLAADHAVHADRAASSVRARAARRLGGLAAEEPDRLGEEPVPGQDRDILAVLDVRGRQAAAQAVVVHRGQVVVDQRVGVDQLERRRDRQVARRVGASARAVARARTGRTRLPPASSE